MSNNLSKTLLAILLVDGLLWLRSAIGKVTSGKFVENLPATLERFASNNPYSWYQELLRSSAIPNAGLIGTIVMYGELLAALILIGGSFFYLTLKRQNQIIRLVLLAGLVFLSTLNIMFWFASGWTSSSTDTVNLLMFTVQAVAIFALLK